jgi:hypothetical protein
MTVCKNIISLAITQHDVLRKGAVTVRGNEIFFVNLWHFRISVETLRESLRKAW